MTLIIITSVAIFKIIESNFILLCGWEEHCEYEPDERPTTFGDNEISQIVVWMPVRTVKLTIFYCNITFMRNSISPFPILENLP